MTRRFVSALLAVSLAAFGQAPVTDKTVLRTTTRLVQIGVVVHRGNAPATGLTKDDFEIFDNGTEQRVATFSGGEPNVSTSSTLAGGGAPRVFSNRSGRVVTPTIILFDALNTPPNEQDDAKKQVVRCLTQMESSSGIALYALNSKLLVLHDFTSDTAHLRKVLEAYRSGQPVFDLNPGRSDLPTTPATAGTPLDAMARQANIELSGFNANIRVDRTIAALEAIAKHLKPIPGRKNLIWISSSFPVNIQFAAGGSNNTRPQVQRLARAVADADIAIYTVQTRGLTNLTTQDASAAGRSSRRMQLPTAPPSMTMLADGTGGKAFFNTNAIAAAVQNALSDSDATYVLGFYPDEKTLDGKYHDVRVKLKTRGGDLRYRRGYFANPDVPLTAEQRQQEVQAAISSPLESTGVSMKVRTDPADQPKPGSVRLIVGIDLNSLTLLPKGDHRAGAVQMMVAQQSANGARVTNTDETIRLDLTPEEFTRMSSDGLVLVKYVEPATDAFQIRVFVLDTNSGAIGSVFVPITK